MAISYHLLQLSPLFMFLLVVGFFILISFGSTLLFKRYVRLTIRHADNKGIGDIFVVIGGLYSLLMGFVVFLVWDSFNTAHVNADREGSLARGLYRDIRYYPDSARIAPLLATYVAYVNHTVEHEFVRLETMQPLTAEDRLAFNKVFAAIEAFPVRDDRTEQMFRHLNELDTFRSLRQLDAAAVIPGAIWMTLLIGGFLILVFSMILEFDNFRLHILLNSLLGVFIGLIVYIILLLDHPFTGSIKIEPEAYRQILTLYNSDK